MEETENYMLMDELNDWKNVTVSIGIAGQSRAGKSSFINTILGTSSVEKATEGIGNTTKTRKQYQHPRNKGLLLWDLPGYDTPEFQLNKQYFNDCKILDYDFVLIMFSQVLTTIDIEFARELKEKKKTFALVRTNADNLLGSHEKSFKLLCEEVKQSTKSTLKAYGFEKVHLFVMSNRRPGIGDFGRLMNFLFRNVPKSKRMNIILSLDRKTAEKIDEIEKSFLQRSRNVAASIGLFTALPIHIKDDVDDKTMEELEKEILLYLTAFQLDAESLGKIPKCHTMKLKKSHDIHRFGIQEFIKDSIIEESLMPRATYLAGSYVPFFGNAIHGTVSGIRLHNFLKRIIPMLAEEARELNRLLNNSLVL